MPGPDDTPIPDFDPGRRPRWDTSWKIKAAAVAAVVLAFLVLGRIWTTCLNDCHSIEALAVTQNGTDAVGEFRIVTARFSGIETDRLAGGCLTFRDPHGAGCVHGAYQCQTPLLARLRKQDPAARAFAYCAPDKSCWYKISEAHCRKSAQPGEGPYPVGALKQTPIVSLPLVRQALFPEGPVPAQIGARVIACLNGRFDGTKALPPCASAPTPGDYVEVFGNSTLLTL